MQMPECPAPMIAILILAVMRDPLQSSRST